MSPFIYTIRWKDNYSVHCTYPQLLLYALFSPVLAVFDKDDLLYYHAVQPLIGHKQAIKWYFFKQRIKLETETTTNWHNILFLKIYQELDLQKN